jgi:hypothetical protein
MSPNRWWCPWTFEPLREERAPDGSVQITSDIRVKWWGWPIFIAAAILHGLWDLVTGWFVLEVWPANRPIVKVPRARCGFVPPTPGYAPCTREAGHAGPCAHPLSNDAAGIAEAHRIFEKEMDE